MSFLGDAPPPPLRHDKATKPSLLEVLALKFSETLTEALETPEGQKIAIQIEKILSKLEGEQGKAASAAASAIVSRILIALARRRRAKKALVKLGIPENDAKQLVNLFGIAVDVAAARTLGEKKQIESFYEKLAALKTKTKE